MQISDAMRLAARKAFKACRPVERVACQDFGMQQDDILDQQLEAALQAALAGHVVVPLAIFDELKRRDDTISKIGPRGEQLTESVRANECSSAWSLVSAMISAAPAQREG